MEQAKYFLSRNLISDKGLISYPNHRISIKRSWKEEKEEEAFFEDSVNIFSWPPRFYTCGFCGREFRSAQALGGHMNVHRRDRARLRQHPIAPISISTAGSIVDGKNPNPNHGAMGFCVSPVMREKQDSLLSCTQTIRDPDLIKKLILVDQVERAKGAADSSKRQRIDPVFFSQDVDLELRLGYR